MEEGTELVALHRLEWNLAIRGKDLDVHRVPLSPKIRIWICGFAKPSLVTRIL